MLDDEAREMLGLPTIKSLARRFHAAIEESEELGDTEGVSARDMHRQDGSVRLDDWMDAGLMLFNMGIVSTTRKAVRQPNIAAQELSYHTKEIQCE